MKNYMLLVLLAIFALPVMAEEHKMMMNSNPDQTSEPTAEHHMQNRNPNPTQKPEHQMKNDSPNSPGYESSKESSSEPVDIQHLNKK